MCFHANLLSHVNLTTWHHSDPDVMGQYFAQFLIDCAVDAIDSPLLTQHFVSHIGVGFCWKYEYTLVA
jgi:hypothetical protein